MAGVFGNILEGWRGEWEVTALYAAQQAILTRFRRHVGDLAASGRTKQDLLMQFDESLAELHVHRLQKPVESIGVAHVSIPIVPKHSIVLYATKATFADVIALYHLLRTKHALIPNAAVAVAVDLEHELRECCLLKGCTNDRVIRWLIALWDGTFEGTLQDNFDEGRPSPTSPTDFRQPQLSNAYPANLIMTRQPFDGVKHAEVVRSGRVKGPRLVLPPLPSRLDVTFVLASNAERLDLVLPGTCTLPVTEASLDGTLQIDEGRLSEDHRKHWGALCGTLLEGVTLQFLFTSGGHWRRREGTDR
jgi:hypothetical protein